MAKLLSGVLILFTVLFSFAVNAAISTDTQYYLDQQNFAKAKVSIEKDLEKDGFDAKTWYFYSRILYQLDRPRAAKQALNNALNIDRNWGFISGKQPLTDLQKQEKGMAFAQDIMADIGNQKSEANTPMIAIGEKEYDAYLTSIFGAGHRFSKHNPPSLAQISSAKRKLYANNKAPLQNNETAVSQTSKIKQNDLKTENLPMSTLPPVSQNANNQASQNSGQSGEGTKTVLTIFVIAFVLFSIGFVVVSVRNKKKEQEAMRKRELAIIENNKKEAQAFFDEANNFNEEIEEKLKDIEVMAKNSEIHKMALRIYDQVLNLIKNIDLNKVFDKNIKEFNSLKSQYDEMIQYYKRKDFDLQQYRQDQIVLAEKRRVEEERLAKIRAEREKQEAIEREKRRVREEKERKEREERERIEAKREAERERNRPRHSSSSSSSGSDLLTGVVLGSLLSGSSKSSSRSSRNDDDDDNSSLWSSASRGNSDSNRDVWNSDNNSDVFGGSSSSKSNKDSDNW